MTNDKRLIDGSHFAIFNRSSVQFDYLYRALVAAIIDLLSAKLQEKENTYARNPD